LKSEDLKFEELPTKIFKLEFFQNESTVEAACKFFSALLNVLSKGDKSGGTGNKIIIKKILISTIAITKANLQEHRDAQYKKDDKPKYVGSVHKCKVRPPSFPHILKILIQMAGAAEEDGHAHLFRQMGEWLKEYGEDLPEQFEYERQGTYDEDIIRPGESQEIICNNYYKTLSLFTFQHSFTNEFVYIFLVVCIYYQLSVLRNMCN